MLRGPAVSERPATVLYHLLRLLCQLLPHYMLSLSVPPRSPLKSPQWLWDWELHDGAWQAWGQGCPPPPVKYTNHRAGLPPKVCVQK